MQGGTSQVKAKNSDLQERVDAAELGAMMREMRENLGHDLKDVAEDLRIRLVYLEAIESGKLSLLPGSAYVSGFIRSYSEFLGLDGDEIVRRFRMAGAEISSQTRLHLPSPVEEGRLPTMAVLLVAAIIAGGAYGGWYYLSSHGKTPAVSVAPVPAALTGEPKPSPAPAGTGAPTAAPVVVPEASTAPAESAAPSSAASEAASQAPSQAVSPAEAAKPAAPPETPANLPQGAAPGGAAVAPNAAGSAAPAPVASAEAPARSAPEPAPVPAPAPEVRTEAPATAPAAPEAPAPRAAESQPEKAVIPAPEPAPRAAVAEAAPSPPAAAEKAEATAEPDSTPDATPEPSPVSSDAASAETARAGSDTAVTPGGKAVPAESSRIVIRAVADSYVAVLTSDAQPLFAQLMRPGDTYEVPSGAHLVLQTGNAGGLQITVGGRQIPPLGQIGDVRDNILLDADSLLRSAR